jgi:hypothetical protein
MVAWGQDDEVADRYPNRVHFIAADDRDHGMKASRALAEGDPVALVSPSGDEVVIEPGENGTPARVEVRDPAGQPLAA